MFGCNTAKYKRLQRVLPCQCNYTAHAIKQRTGICRGFSYDCTRSTAHDTRLAQSDIIPPAPRWRAYTRPDALHLYQIPPPRRDAAQVSTVAYYNKVYKRADHTSGGGSARRGPDASHARQRAVWHRVNGQGGRSGTLHPAGQSSGRGAAGGAEPLAATAASLLGLSPDS